MEPEDLTKFTGIGTVKEVWEIWSSTMPLAWNVELGAMCVALTPPDEDGRVLVAIPRWRYVIAGLDDLVEIKAGTAVRLKDGRRGRIRTYKAFSPFFFFDDYERDNSSLVPIEDIVRAEPAAIDIAV